MHYYKRNLGDYAKKAGRLSMLQHGAYTLLLDACYDREQFPTLAEAVDWTWASSAAEIEAVEFVLRKFFTLEGERYVQKRIQEEIAEYRIKAETNARIAQERETKRREKQTNRARGVDESRQKTNDSPPNQEPLTNNQEPLPPNGGAARKRAAPITKPDDVTDQTWADWLALRKAKKAPVTETVLREAVKESEKAGLPLEQFLCVWCSRGSQGLQADWLKPHELQPHRPAAHDTPIETYAQRAARQRMEEVAPMAARKAPGAGGGFEAAQRFMAGGSVIDVTPRDVAPRITTGSEV